MSLFLSHTFPRLPAQGKSYHGTLFLNCLFMYNFVDSMLLCYMVQGQCLFLWYCFYRSSGSFHHLWISPDLYPPLPPPTKIHPTSERHSCYCLTALQTADTHLLSVVSICPRKLLLCFLQLLLALPLLLSLLFFWCTVKKKCQSSGLPQFPM